MKDPFPAREGDEMHKPIPLSEEERNLLDGMYKAMGSKSRDPNGIGYQDDKGVEHVKYLPPGTFEAACEHLEAERWDELAKFEPFNDKYCTDSQMPEENSVQGEGSQAREKTEQEAAEKK